MTAPQARPPAHPAVRPRLRDIITPWRVLYTVALTVAALLIIFGFQKTRTTRAVPCSGAAIARLIPCPGDTSLTQGIIGASLAAGYQGALQIDGVEIPEDQMRTGGSNQFYFQPGPGTETGALAAGEHHVTLIYWPAGSDREHGQTISWTFASQ